MSAYIIEEKILDALGTGKYGFTLINLPTPTWLAYRKNETTIAAVEAVDGCLGKIIPEILKIGGHIFITADHGNAEETVNPRTEEMDTEHSPSGSFLVFESQKHKQKSESEILNAKNNIGGL